MAEQARATSTCAVISQEEKKKKKKTRCSVNLSVPTYAMHSPLGGGNQALFYHGSLAKVNRVN